MNEMKRPSLIPSLTVGEADLAIKFYERAFGAKLQGEPFRSPDGKKIMHAEMKIGDTMFYLNDEMPGQCFAPSHYGGTSVSMYLNVPDVDKTFKEAVTLGAEQKMSPQDMFWGDRYAQISDPWGHLWGISTNKEQLTPEQIKQRSQEFFREMAKK